MLGSTDSLLLYHGSYAPVEHIDLARCAAGKDFGQGFYLTSSYEQARDFIPLSLRKRQAEHSESVANEGFVSKYRLSSIDGLQVHAFEEANADWLHFVAANRRIDLFPELLDVYRSFDIIIGKIANDRTARTLQLYVAGAFGEPGEEEADAIAIATLLPNRLKDQFCFRSPRAVARLVFEGSDRYEL